MPKPIEGQTGADVLRECIADIDDGKWVCAYLQIQDHDKPNPREMACAVGLVSLNSGDTVTNKVKLGPYYEGIEDDDSLGEIHIGNNHVENNCTLKNITPKRIKKGVKVEIARYTDSKSPPAAKEAIKFLYEAIPDWYFERYSSKAIGIVRKQKMVVDYNDNYLEDSENAKKWFEEALRLAEGV